MSEAFVDVMWRGLEVGKRVKLHAIHPADAYIDHATPMPVGTVLSLKTDEGLEIPVTVLRVHEQVGGSTETPGMSVKPLLADVGAAAATWWDQRREVPRARPEPDTGPPPMGTPAPALSPAALAAADDPRAAIVAKPTLTMSTVEVERALKAVKGAVEDEADAGNTEVMSAVDPALLEAIAVEERGDPGLVDDGKRTMQMSVADVNAIVEAADESADVTGPMNGGNGHGDEPSSDDAGASGSRASGKKRRGKRNKRGTQG
jgi:hypothetical protein